MELCGIWLFHGNSAWIPYGNSIIPSITSPSYVESMWNPYGKKTAKWLRPHPKKMIWNGWNPYGIHRNLIDSMWIPCGMWGHSKDLEKHAGCKTTIATNVVDSISSSKQSENVMPLVGRSLASEVGEAAPGVPLFSFSKTSFSAL
jgi:hypothetical protein